MINRITGEVTNMKCSAMKYYSYQLMIQENEDNPILKCCQLFNQYIVDMFAKIETEYLILIHLNQTKIHSEEHVHLWDAVVNCDHTTNVGKLMILQSSYTSSPHHMPEAIVYVLHHGHPDLFITFTCNPAWDDIHQLLLLGLLQVDVDDITACLSDRRCNHWWISW